MDILLLSQYFDTLSAVGANQLFLEHDPATVASLQKSVGSSFLKAGELHTDTYHDTHLGTQHDTNASGHAMEGTSLAEQPKIVYGL
jgi:hypothetical protein